MELNKKLLEQGWHLTDDGLQKVIATASNTGGPEVNDVRKIISTIMDMDFRDIAGGALPIKRDDNIPGRIVLQLQKTRNISAPKSNEDSKAAPRFLQLELSDGLTTIQALELENISALSMNLPPGTKIYFRAEKIQLMQGFLILRSSEIQVLGGRVEPMIEKWELARTMQKYARSGRRMSGATGPPPWIPFGKKVETSLSKELNFKSLKAGLSEGKESKENEEFNAMRSEAIAEASKAGAKKVFGGGGQQMLDHNVKKILEKGFSEEEAKQALRATNNNLERALFNLKRRGEIKRTDDFGSSKNSQVNSFNSAKTSRGPTREIGLGKRGGSIVKEETIVAKPAGNVSLFDFLTDKLPVDAGSNTPIMTTTHTTALSNIPGNPVKPSKLEKNKKEAPKSTHSDNKNAETNADSNSSVMRPRFENNMSSSFAANHSIGPPNFRQRSDRGSTVSRGGLGNNERGRSTSNFNPFKDTGNERINSASRLPGSQSTNNNQNQSRNNRGSYERGKVSNQLSRDLQQSGASGGGKRGNEKQQQKSHGGEERSSGPNESRNRFTSKHDSSSRQQNNNADTQNLNNSNSMNNLIEATSKMKVSDSERSDHHLTGTSSSGEGRPNSHNYQNTSQNFGASQLPNQIQGSTQFPNGYAYDTSKIIGFQNKETNEFAMTLLKSQGLGSSESTVSIQQQQQLLSDKANNRTSQPSLQISNDNYISPVSPHLQTPSQLCGYAAPTSDYSVPTPTTVSTVAPIPSHFGMVPGDGWHWKVGDLCFAKYWDDGRYYEAEVTAVSEKTCVVFYLGYGNHEEVLKSDCLPITDGNHCPINNYNAATSYQQSQQGKSRAITSAHPAQQIQTGGAYQRGGGGSQRFRGERQMYVPPHKRDN
ncbi:tudor domain-containing protein 3 [Anastrepha ludens]|uniref:tudor domain-containing protein 3 n=1 Tax=Anastrepha ludens TaxID=28586 RepID=UPI0023B06477|nr:tudor domain-containing protein 3 [Anastrepha ludens]